MSKPAIFSDLSLHEARLQANAANKLLLIDFTAEWCAPCKNMDKTTWRDPSVVAWVEANAIAIQIDGDSMRDEVESFGVRAYPTLVLERNGTALDQSAGARNASQLLTWLDNARSGRRELDQLLSAENPTNHDRLKRGRMLEGAGRDDEAMNEFVWLWEHALENDEAWVGVRSSFLIGAMEPLVRRNASARERVQQLRDTAGARRTEEASFDDWVTLSLLLNDAAAVLAWLGEIDAPLAENLRIHRNHRVLDLLREHNQWALLGRLLRNASELLTEEHRVHQQALSNAPAWVDPEMLKDTRVWMANALRRRAGDLRKALLAVSRNDEAETLKETALKLDGSSEMRRALETEHQSSSPADAGWPAERNDEST